jgi:hypothetical protein
VTQESNAATIIVNAPDVYGRTFVDVVGDLADGDDKAFMDKVGTPAEPEKVVVTLMSNGGQPSAIGIGDFIRLTGMTTFVPAGQTCASACAFVWLAGAHRLAGANAHVGFHGIYDAATGLQPVLPNVILATYLGYLGYSYEAVLWMLSPRPLGAHWLTAETAKQYGIFFQALDPPRTVALPPGPESQQQRPVNPQVQPSSPAVSLRVVQDLHLRQQPDPRARDVLGPPPDDYMPKGSQVTVVSQCRLWTISGRGEQDADNVWCPIIYRGYRGWANAYFLAFSDGHRLACVIYPKAQGCPSAPLAQSGASNAVVQEVPNLDPMPPSADVW